MKQYSENSIYLSAYAKLPSEMPSAEMYKALDIGLVINWETGEIEDASITLLTDEARSFLKQIIVGYNIDKNAIEPLLERIKKRYLGASQKAVCVILKLIYEKYINWRQEHKK
ncbi:DUF3870 domain-containing protein [Sinanaerobacter chloroacetimidivorans]|jgi:hypothetical protein|uniref:DUF3870 domain-containing protein n=1 Tax=Sinanaerobacter chloroacetimidivorans TaxID=2818044 RepID=A0A8J7W464_9FIRM|nr:DUF3870 domain-containing protein [Sinanaerobacter chloroacetimidivorans]MBR0600632.1 DUF3870 domain-containing protein [Sinanaerobacter chloroacetimidivorans]